MDGDSVCIGVHNFFVSLALVPIVVYEFVKMWLSANSTVNEAGKIFSEKLLKMELPEQLAEDLARDYTSVKDYVFEGFLKRNDKIQKSNARKSGSFKNVLIKILPGGQVLLRMRTESSKDVTGAVFLDATKTIILLVAVSRALERDVYWVAVCIVSYILYSSLFGLASELIAKHQGISEGLLGSVIDTLGETFSDTKVVVIVGLALASHSILAAPFVPLYHVIPGLDFVEHYLSGFGIGLFAVKTYRTFVSYVSYNKALTMIGSVKLGHQISLFEASAELPFVCYSSVFVGLVWEGLEEIAEKFTPRVVNVFFWNGVIDIIMNLLGALTAYIIVCHSIIIKKQEKCSNSSDKKTKVDLRAVKRASARVLMQMKDIINIVYSKSTTKDFYKETGVTNLPELARQKGK